MSLLVVRSLYDTLGLEFDFIWTLLAKSIAPDASVVEYDGGYCEWNFSGRKLQTVHFNL